MKSDHEEIDVTNKYNDEINKSVIDRRRSSSVDVTNKYNDEINNSVFDRRRSSFVVGSRSSLMVGRRLLSVVVCCHSLVALVVGCRSSVDDHRSSGVR